MTFVVTYLDWNKDDGDHARFQTRLYWTEPKRTITVDHLPHDERKKTCHSFMYVA